jgi:hypothetical protein
MKQRCKPCNAYVNVNNVMWLISYDTDRKVISAVGAVLINSCAHAWSIHGRG